MTRLHWFLSGFVCSATLASAGNISFTCDASIDAAVAGTCTALNSTIAGLYGNTFSNANANIYIKYGTTSLGQSTLFQNFVTYDTYRNALVAHFSGSALDTAALASLPVVEPNGFGDINLTTSLATALGITSDMFGDPITGITAGGATCTTLGSAGCYDAIVTLSNPADLSSSGQGYFYRTGAQDPNAYDFYSIVEHETDEVLGSSSCIDTTGASLTDGCGGTNAAPVDLFRYNAGSRVLLDTTPGAYFSFDGGITNGAHGALYDTLADGDDYGDFVSNCQYIQDGTGCLGSSFDITNDGGAEINILDAIGYNLSPTASIPEPGTVCLLGVGLALLARRLRQSRKT